MKAKPIFALHRKAQAWIRVLLAVAAGAVAGCGGSGGAAGSTPPPVASGGLLVPVGSEAALLQAVRDGFLQQATTYQGGVALAMASAADAGGVAPATFSSTYTLEPNVDEFDSVKYDGKTLFVQSGNAVGAVLADKVQSGAAVASLGMMPVCCSTGSTIRVLDTQLRADQPPALSEVARIAIDPSLQPMGMYLSAQRLATLAGTSYYGSYGAPWQDISRWDGPHTRVLLHDVSLPASPKLAHDIDIEGGFVQSRRIGDTVYLVTRHTPHLAFPAIGMLDASGKPSALYAEKVAQLGATDVIPRLTLDGVARPLFDAKNCLAPSASDPSVFASYPVITSITALSLSDPSLNQSLCYLGESYGMYLGESAVYLTQSRYSTVPATATVASSSSVDTRLHKFALSGRSIAYRGSADVPGTVWASGQADFRMSEYQGDLRLLTTSFTGNATSRFEHRLLVLRESPSETALKLLATLPNAANPQAIGKPNEDLFGVRFFGDRAYAVTFQRKDPLYAFDLSDPTHPFIAGSLELPGYSTFLHPVSRDLLLGLGQDAQNRLKVELFQVTDLAAPASRGSVTLGGPWSYSEALYNRNAFAYLVGTTDRFALPATLTAEAGGAFSQSGQYQFEVRDKATPAQATLLQVGSLVTASADATGYGWGGYGARSVIVGAATLFVDQAGVWPGLWGYDQRPAGPR